MEKNKDSLIESENFKMDQNRVINAKTIGTDHSFKREIVWESVFLFSLLYFLALWGLGVLLTGGLSFKGFIWCYFLGAISMLATTVASHRYYAHRSFKAKPFLKAIFMIAQTINGEFSMYNWVRDHRIHHRYSDTDADPHNAKHGFFFSHLGWLLLKKHPYVAQFGKRIDMSDIEADWMVMFQKKYYLYLYIPLAVLIPVWVPVHYFGDTWLNSFLVCYALRFTYTLNMTMLINSAAHTFGTRPYDKTIQPVESWFVSLLHNGEGWHNYHHAFPWDYNAAELPMPFNVSATVIRFLERIGLAYDLKSPSEELVKTRIMRAGDGTHYKLGNDKAKSAVTAIGPLHPLNPSYRVKYEAPKATLSEEGLPLFHENDIFNVTSNKYCVRTRNVAAN